MITCRILGSRYNRDIQQSLARGFASSSNTSALKLKFNKYSPAAPPTRPPIVFLHGLFGNKINFSTAARKLSKELELEAYTLDCRNHGASPWSDSMRLEDIAGDVKLFIEGLGTQAGVVGHSLGGKSGMILACTASHLVHKACIVDISPTAYPAERLQNTCEALSLINLDLLKTRREAYELLEDVIPDINERSFILSNLIQYSKEKWRWRINLNAIQDHCHDLRGWPDNIPVCDIPTLFLYGEKSGYLTDERIKQTNALFPSATFHSVPDAGHTVQLDQPDLFYQHIYQFFH